MEFKDLSEFMSAGKSALDLLKAAYGVLPKGVERDKIEAEIKRAEDLLSRSDAKLAKDLGYKICQCTFPPQVMLWRENDKAWVCPNADCGAKIERERLPDPDHDPGRLVRSRGGFGRK